MCALQTFSEVSSRFSIVFKKCLRLTVPSDMRHFLIYSQNGYGLTQLTTLISSKSRNSWIFAWNLFILVKFEHCDRIASWSFRSDLWLNRVIISQHLKAVLEHKPFMLVIVTFGRANDYRIYILHKLMRRTLIRLVIMVTREKRNLAAITLQWL